MIHATKEGNLLIPILYWLTKSWSDVNTVVSEKAQNYLVSKCKILPRSTLVIHNFLINRDLRGSLKTEKKRKNKNFKLLFVGRLSPEKNPLILIKLMRFLKNKNKKVQLDIVGDGALKSAIELKIKKEDLNEQVFLHGQTNPDLFYKNCDLVIIPSKSEGFGMVLIEAIFFGKDFITSTEVPTKEIVGEKLNSFVPNDPQTLFELVEQKISVKLNIDHLLVRKKRILSKFDKNIALRKWLYLYQSLVANQKLK